MAHSVLTKTISVLLLFCFLSLASGISFEFPAKYQSNVGGWVSDVLSNHKKIVSSGWMYVDNTIPSMRVDEVWDLSTTVGTGLYDDLGVIADTHLYYENYSLLFYTTPEGPSCSNSTSGIPPQQWPASTFIDTVDFEGKAAYQFNQTYGKIPTTLYVDVESSLPLAMYFGAMSNLPNRLWDGSMLYFHSIFPVDSFNASSVLFSTPSYCYA